MCAMWNSNVRGACSKSALNLFTVFLLLVVCLLNSALSFSYLKSKNESRTPLPYAHIYSYIVYLCIYIYKLLMCGTDWAKSSSKHIQNAYIIIYIHCLHIYIYMYISTRHVSPR